MEKLTMRRTASETRSPFWDSFVLPLLRYRRMTYVVVTTAVLATLVYCLLLPNQYTSVATILPTGGTDELGELRDLASGSLAELGLGTLIQASEYSSATYPKVLTSRLMSERILGHEFAFQHKDEAKTFTLKEYIDVANTDLAIQQLGEIVTVDLDRRTGFISLAATTIYPEFSSQIVKTYLELLDDYNINYRQSKARDNEHFIAGRMDEARIDLETAETVLQQFRKQNLNYLTSTDPELQREQSRLEREVSVKEAVYLTLVKKHELAKLEAAKDVPIVQVLDNGAIPQIKSSPRRSLYLIAAFLSSLMISFLLSFWFDLSVKRSFRHNLENVILSPDVQVNRIESKIVNRASRLISMIEPKSSNNKTTTMGNNNDQETS